MSDSTTVSDPPIDAPSAVEPTSEPETVPASTEAEATPVTAAIGTGAVFGLAAGWFMTTDGGQRLGGGAFLLFLFMSMGLNGGAAKVAAYVTFAVVAALAANLRRALGA